MDCMDARMALSALRDGEPVDAACAEALEHAKTCTECREFARGLAALDAMPSPAAPAGLADRILATVHEEAGRQAAAAAASQAPPTVDLTPAAPQHATSLPPWLTRTRLWTATAGVTLAAAAVVVAVAVSSQSAPQLAGTIATEDTAREKGSAGLGATAAVPPPAATAAVTTAPDYVAFESYAYIAGATMESTSSAVTTIGVTQNALRGSSVLSVPVLRAAGSTGDILLALPSGGLQVFSPVTRRLGTGQFRLAAGVLDRFGQWPTLPAEWSPPGDLTGSPYYRRAGTDALGVPVFVRIGQTPDLGFLVAPGTAATDPAAGNPNWTLWLPTQ